MDEPTVKRALWVLALPLVPLLLAAAVVGGLTAAAADGPVWLGALSGYAITAVGTTAVLAFRTGWGQAVAMVAVASLLGFGGLALIGGLVTLVVVGLVMAVCGGFR